jgi:hypothetical protein
MLKKMTCVYTSAILVKDREKWGVRFKEPIMFPKRAKLHCRFNGFSPRQSTRTPGEALMVSGLSG